MNPSLYRTLLYPLYHYINGNGKVRCLEETRKIQWMTPEKLRELQNDKLEALLMHAFEKVPYYRRLFLNMGLKQPNLLDNFQRIPILTKSLIRKNLNDLCSTEYNRSARLIPNSTSGSTGEKLIFYYDRDSGFQRDAVVNVDLEALGIRQGERIAKLWGAPMDLSKAASLRGKMHGLVTNKLMLTSYRLSEESLKLYLERLKAFKPTVLISYPTPLVTFCNYLKKRSESSLPTLKAIVASAETLFPWQKKLIEETLKCSVFNRYGSREFGDIAHEFGCRNGLHVHTHRFVVEILNDKLQPVSPGETGEIFVTDLDNFGMPFLRYQIGDLGSWSTDQNCTCGRGWPLLSKIEGRSFDVVAAPNGNRIGGTFWTILFRKRPGIRRFQVHQLQSDQIVVRYVPDPEFENLPPESVRFWTKSISDMCGDDLRLDFVRVDDIELTASGKTRIVISEMANAAQS